MKIAIVAPSPVPFTIGGAENLLWGLLDYINQQTNYQAELIKLPSRESCFAEIVASYDEFSRLDLSYFDCVISTKYPSWMVQHDYHICYMLHRLRGLYDTYPIQGSHEILDAPQAVYDLLSNIDRHWGDREAMEDVLAEIKDVYRTHADSPQNLFSFPGLLTRKIVHYFDGIGLNPKYIRRYAAISKNVTHRQNYFPPGVKVQVAYPPSNLRSFSTDRFDYLFTVSRLDGAKRVSLLVEAMKQVKADITLRIAGTGPEERRLKDLAAGDPRIQFLGFLNDSEIIKQYSNALAVLYVPFDEDYGLITIEAMMSSKPVITCTDSGGPNEFVANGETGFSVLPTLQSIAEHIDFLCTNVEAAMRMGVTAREKVRTITWGKVVEVLLGEPQSTSKPSNLLKNANSKPKITVATTFPIYPPQGGGQTRIFHLYKQLAKNYQIELITFTEHEQPPFHQEIAPGLWEIRIPKSMAHQQSEKEISRQLDWIPVSDVVMPSLYKQSPEYLEALSKSCKSSEILIASHPYLTGALREISSKPLWYEAQDVEWILKNTVLPDNELGRQLLRDVREIESHTCSEAEVIIVCSKEDGELLVSLYGVSSDRIAVVPNGVDTNSVYFCDGETRLENKKSLQLDGFNIACFMGSWHPPNLEAIEILINIAFKCPQIVFFIIGSACGFFQTRSLPSNVKLLGILSEEEKNIVLGACDLALNPMRSGSGTNLKMFDYFAAGLPVLTSPFGARGLGIQDGTEAWVREIDDFHDSIKEIFTLNFCDRAVISRRARALVESKFDWSIIAGAFMSWLQQRSLI